MTDYVVKLKCDVTNAETGECVKAGELFVVNDYDRFCNIIKNDLGFVAGVDHHRKTYKHKIILLCNYLAEFGGIETATLNLVERYGEKYDLTIVMPYTISQLTLAKVAKYANVMILQPETKLKLTKNDVVIVINYNAAEYLKQIEGSPVVYQQSHCVWDEMPNLKFESLFCEQKDRIRQVLSVSKDACRGLKDRYDVFSAVVPNVALDPRDQALVLGFFSRSSAEKGFETIIPAIEKLRIYKKPFLFLISTDATDTSLRDFKKLHKIPEVLFIDKSVRNSGFMRNLDFLWQISDSESMGLSAYEALLSGVPVIASKIPAFQEIIKDGENGFLVNKDLSDLPIEKMYKLAEKNRKKALIKIDRKTEDELWNKVFEGKL